MQSVDIMTLDLNKNKILGYIEFFYRIIIKSFSEYDALYINHWSHIYYPFLFKNLKNKNVIINYHGSDLMGSSLLKKINNKIGIWFLPKGAKVVVPSKYFKKIIKKYKINNEIYEIPSGGVDTNKFYKQNIKKGKNDKVNIGFCSGITYSKGYDVIINLLIRLKESNLHNEIIFNIINYGSERERFHSLIEENKLDDSVIYYKVIEKEEMIKFYNNMDYILFPTRKEALGLVALESMACGVPVIATNDFAIPEYIINSENGFLFNIDSEMELFNIIKRIINNEMNYEALSNSAVDIVNLKYRREKSIELYNNLIEDF